MKDAVRRVKKLERDEVLLKALLFITLLLSGLMLVIGIFSSPNAADRAAGGPAAIVFTLTAGFLAILSKLDDRDHAAKP